MLVQNCHFYNIFYLKNLLLVSDLDDPALNIIYEKYLNCLRIFTRKHFPNQPNRVEDLLVRLPEVRNLFQPFHLCCAP